MQLVTKSRDKDINYQIFECVERKKIRFLSRDFAMFISRKIEKSEFDQVQNIVDIDISPYQRFPKNYELDTGELEYRLYNAEKKHDHKRANEIKAEITQKKIDWENSYETDNTGWSTVEEYIHITSQLISQVQEKVVMLKTIKPPEGWDYNWGDYFYSLSDDENADTLLNDLKRLLAELECVVEHSITYVAIYGA